MVRSKTPTGVAADRMHATLKVRIRWCGLKPRSSTQYDAKESEGKRKKE
jgi:hypothetical protein